MENHPYCTKAHWSASRVLSQHYVQETGNPATLWAVRCGGYINTHAFSAKMKGTYVRADAGFSLAARMIW